MVGLRRTKALALLVYVAATHQPQNRDALLWPEFDQASARNNLRRELSLLKTLLGEEVLIADRLQVAWNDQATAWVDVAMFEEQVAIWKQHAHAPGEACAACMAALTTAAGVDAAWGSEAIALRRDVDLTPGDAAAGPREALDRIHLDAVQRGEVDHQATVAGAVAGDAVAAAHRQDKIMHASEIDRGDDIVDRCTSMRTYPRAGTHPARRFSLFSR